MRSATTSSTAIRRSPFSLAAKRPPFCPLRGHFPPLSGEIDLEGKALSYQIRFHIIDKLIATSGKFAKNTIYSLLSRMPIILRYVETMNRTYLYLNIGKSHLIKHKATSGMKRFADNQCCFYLNTAFVNDFSGQKRIVTSMSRFIFSDYCFCRHAILHEHIGKKLTVGLIITIIYFCLRANARPLISLNTNSTGRNKPLCISLMVQFSRILRLFRM